MGTIEDRLVLSGTSVRLLNSHLVTWRWRLQSFERATLDEEQAKERLYAHDVSKSQQSEKRQENRK